MSEHEETTQNFWQAYSQWQPRPAEKIFRLYYDEHGAPLFYSTDDVPGNYIDIDQETFGRSPSNVRVISGKLIMLDSANLVDKLQPGDHGIACDPRDVCVVVEDHRPNIKWAKKQI